MSLIGPHGVEDDMSMKEELVDVIKALVLPEIAELKQGLAEVKAELKVTNSRLDLLEERYDGLRDQMNQRFDQVDKRFEQVDKRFEQMERRLQELHEDIREVRSYVWTGGYEKAKAERQSAVQERSETYRQQEESGKG